MSAITILLVAIVALLAGMEGILDEFQFHQPLVACTLIGLVTGHLQEGILLGGSLQMMALGWANVGAAVAPDAALASVASSIIMVLALNGGATDSAKAVTAAIAVAVPLSVAGLFLTMICRTIATAIAHAMDGCAEKGDFSGIERWQYAAILMQGLRIAIPAVLLCIIPAEAVTNALNAMPDWLHGCRRRHGRFRRLRHGHQHDGHQGDLAVLRPRLCPCCHPSAHADRPWPHRHLPCPHLPWP